MFERMAQLYEHIGDLVLQGDVRKTTEAYQEAPWTTRAIKRANVYGG